MTAIPLGKILLFLAFAIPLVVLARSVARVVCKHTDAYTQNTLIVGAGIVGQRVALKLLHHPEYGVNVVGFVDENPRERSDDLGDLMILGKPAELPEIVRDYDVERVIVAFSKEPHADTLELVRDLNEIDVQVDIVPRLFEVIGPHATIHAAEGLPLMGLAPARLGQSSLVFKRTMDIVGSVVGLLVLAPFFALVALADQARLARPCLLPADTGRPRRPGIPDPEVPDDGRRRRRAQARDRSPQQASGRRRAHVQDRRRSTRDPGRSFPAAPLARRVSAVDQRLCGRDEPRRPPTADSRRSTTTSADGLAGGWMSNRE